MTVYYVPLTEREIELELGPENYAAYCREAQRQRREKEEWRSTLLGDPCAYCGGTAEQIDHVTPRHRGGRDDYANLAPACARCNQSKGTRSLLGHLGTRRLELDARLWAQGRP